MALSSVANSDSFLVTTPSECEVRMTRLFDASRERVFEAMTRPEHVKNWWGRLGAGFSVPVCEIDLRVGGAWRFVNRHPHGEAVFYGEYREIVPPSKLVYTEIFAQYPDTVSVITATFSDEGQKTRYTATCAYPSKEVRDIVMSSGMEHGAAQSYDQLEQLLRARS
ncbi:MAG TPA: SRPBCC family protein [Polyangiaceae bacterium]|nr:SRPBCC family protein [Polyangiaceae bacterium]